MNETNHQARLESPFEIFEFQPLAEEAPSYSDIVASIKGGPKGDMDKEDR